MVKKQAKYVEKLRKLVLYCKRKVKQEFQTWKAFYLHLAVNILIKLLSKRRESSVTNDRLFTLPTSASFLDFLRVWAMSRSCSLLDKNKVKSTWMNFYVDWGSYGHHEAEDPVSVEDDLPAACHHVGPHRPHLPPRLGSPCPRCPIPRTPWRRLCSHLSIHLQVRWDTKQI